MRFLQYMLGLSGYWDALAADHEKTLLSPAREGIVRHWREGTIVNARDNFAPATSAMGDVLLAVLTADINRTLGTKAAFVWGAYQEALAQFGVEQSISGWFYTTDLDPPWAHKLDDNTERSNVPEWGSLSFGHKRAKLYSPDGMAHIAGRYPLLHWGRDHREPFDRGKREALYGRI